MPLIANDNSWALCMPKRTGSQSLVEMLCQDGGVAHLRGDWHGGTWDGKGKRLMIVRNPYDRLASMHWFSLTTDCHLFRGCDNPADWLARFFELRRSGGEQQQEWTVTQSELAAEFHPDQVFRFEDGLEKVVAAVGVDVPIVHHNSATLKPFDETFADIKYLPAAVVDEWCQPDMEAWY